MRLNNHITKIPFLLIINLFLLSCTKDEFLINNLDGNKIKIVGHGGMGIGSIYPMNCYESIMKCLMLGADGVELDIQMTKDSVLVLYHDHDLSHSTNLKGKINDLIWSEIKNAYYTEFPYFNYSIISLEKLLSNIDNLHRYHYTLDCKYIEEKNKDTYARAVIQIIEKYKLKENIYIESSNEQFLKKIQQEKPEYKLFIYPPSFEIGLQTAIDLDLYGMIISTAIITKEQIHLAHQHGIRVAILNVHSQSENVKAIKKNPDIIQTDNLSHLLKILKRN